MYCIDYFKLIKKINNCQVHLQNSHLVDNNGYAISIVWKKETEIEKFEHKEEEEKLNR